MFSFWLSRRHGVILARGHKFCDRAVHYVLQLDNSCDGMDETEPEACLFEVPPKLVSRQLAQLAEQQVLDSIPKLPW